MVRIDGDVRWMVSLQRLAWCRRHDGELHIEKQCFGCRCLESSFYLMIRLVCLIVLIYYRGLAERWTELIRIVFYVINATTDNRLCVISNNTNTDSTSFMNPLCCVVSFTGCVWLVHREEEQVRPNPRTQARERFFHDQRRDTEFASEFVLPCFFTCGFTEVFFAETGNDPRGTTCESNEFCRFL